MKRRTAAVLVIAFLSASLHADSPETGLVTGSVTDPAGTILPGVMVTLEGERGSQSQVSNEEGAFRFALLTPGSYVVRGTLEGFQAAESAVTVLAGGKHEVDLVMVLATAETITVTSEAPMVDKFNVTAGSTVPSEVGVQTAGTTRTYYGLINTLPGVASDPQNDDIQQTRPSVNGTHFADQQVFIDGVDTTFAKFGGSRVFLPTTAVTEVTMEAGGSSAEYGRAIGSSTNVIVKSGTNNIHAEGLVQHERIDWGSNYKDQPALEKIEDQIGYSADFLRRTGIEETGKSTGYEFSVGGPIKRDRAWYFVGWSRFDDNYIEKLLGGDPVDTSLQNQATIVKLSAQPGTGHQLSFSYINTPSGRVYFNPNSYDWWVPTPHDVKGELANLNYNWSISNSLFLETKIATQTSTENKELACGNVDVASCLARKQQDRGPSGDSIADLDGPPVTDTGDLRFPANPAAGPHWPGNNFAVYVDNSFSVGTAEFPGSWHNGWILSDGFGNNDFPRDQANVALTQFAGTEHELKYGMDFQRTEWTGENHREGYYTGENFSAFNRFGYENAGGLGPDTCSILRSLDGDPYGLAAIFGQGVFCSYTHYDPEYFATVGHGVGNGDSRTEVLALFVRDRATFGDHWTLNVGIRAEDQQGWNDFDRKVFSDSYLAPRLAVNYDLKGNGDMLLSLNAGRYYALLNQEWIAQHMHDGFNGFNGLQTFLLCDPLDALFVATCGGQVGYTSFLREIIPGHMWDLVDQGLWDSDITPYYKDEIIVGFEWQFSDSWALDVKAIDWELKNMIGATTQLGPDGEQFKLVANYKDWPRLLGLFEQMRQAKGDPELIPQSALDGFQEGTKEYRALQLQLNRRFGNGWALYNNVTWSETQTTGAGAWWNNTNSDYGGDMHVLLTDENVDACQAEQATRSFPVDCEVLRPFVGQPISTINRYGDDPVTDRPIIWNTFGYKTWRVGEKQDLTLGGHLTFQSGLPWTRREQVDVIALNPDGTVCTSACVAANPEVDVYVEPYGASGRRNTSEYTLNLSGAWGFPMGGEKVRGEARLEVLNVTDQQRQRYRSGRGEARPIRRDFQRPRQVRVSFRVRF